MQQFEVESETAVHQRYLTVYNRKVRFSAPDRPQDVGLFVLKPLCSRHSADPCNAAVLTTGQLPCALGQQWQLHLRVRADLMYSLQPEQLLLSQRSYCAETPTSKAL